MNMLIERILLLVIVEFGGVAPAETYQESEIKNDLFINVTGDTDNLLWYENYYVQKNLTSINMF